MTTQTTEGTKVNTKTQKIHEQLTTQTYIRAPIKEITKTNKTATRTLILARNGMLECGTNFKGTLPETCRYCNVIDNENHRMNFCTQWEDVNQAKQQEKYDFQDVFSKENDVLLSIMTHIEHIWELKYANGRMKRFSHMTTVISM